MANENVIFRRGPSASIPEQKVPGTVLIETDTGNAFVDDTTTSRVQLTDTRLSVRIDDAISTYGYIENGVLTGDLNASSHSINNLPTPSANGDAANKQYVDTAFTTLESELGTTIAGYLPLKGGTMTGILSLGNYKITEVGAPQADTDATNKTYVDNAVETLNSQINSSLANYLLLSGGTMTGAINMATNKVTNLGTPTDASDAVTKSYVDNINTSITTSYLPLAGGNMTGAISMGGSKITATYTPSNNNDLTNKEYVDNQINEKIQASDAMIFKGTIGSTGATVTQLPASGYKTGWTYRVITEGTYAGKACEVGDMLIALNDGPASGSDVIDADWVDVQGNIDGAVIAPDNLTSNQLVVGSNGEDEVKTLAAGANGQVLKVVDGTPTWSTHTGGSATQPIYLNSTGDPTPISYTIEANVPSDAKFTDTTYSAMQGASASAAGASGLVPAPQAGNQTMYLRGDGTWAAPPQGISSLTDLGVTATATELNYMDGVTSNVQTQLNSKQSTIGTDLGNGTFEFDNTRIDTIAVHALDYHSSLFINATADTGMIKYHNNVSETTLALLFQNEVITVAGQVVFLAPVACDQIPTENTQLVNKSYVDSKSIPTPPGAGYILVSTATGCEWTQAFPYSVVIDDNATS